MIKIRTMIEQLNKEVKQLEELKQSIKDKEGSLILMRSSKIVWGTSTEPAGNPHHAMMGIKKMILRKITLNELEAIQNYFNRRKKL